MRRGLLGLLAGAAIAFSACEGAATPSPAASTAPQTSPSPVASPTPIDYESLLFAYDYSPARGKTGGKVVISDWQAASELNPAYGVSAVANWMVYASTMRSLFTVTSDGHWKPDLAAKMPKFSDDTIRPDSSGTGFSVDVELRPNLKWSDGVPATMDDLEYTWRWVIDPAQVGIATLGWDKIDRIDVADDLHATVHFKEAFAGFYGVIGLWFFPEHYFTTVDVKDANKLYPLSPAIKDAVTIGPFKYSTASADTIELVRDDNWAGPADACGGKACLDGVTYKYYPDNKEGMIAAFLAGEIDVAEDLLETDYDAIKGVNASIGKAILGPSWAYEHLDMNQAGLGQGKGHPALKDLTVRKAMYQAIDKEEMHKTVFPGAPIPEDGFPCTNATPTTYWILPDATCPTFDVAAANSALDAAGYTDSDSDGVRNMPNGGDNLTFEHCTSAAAFRQTGGEFLANSMEAIGIKLNLNYVDTLTVLFAYWSGVAADTKCNLAHGNYDLSEWATPLTIDLVLDYYYSYHSEWIPTDANKGNGLNYLRFSNPEMDAALNTLAAAIKPDEQLQAVHTIQQVYTDQLPEVPLYYRKEARGVSAKLNNFFYKPGALDMWNIQDWWVTR